MPFDPSTARVFDPSTAQPAQAAAPAAAPAQQAPQQQAPQQQSQQGNDGSSMLQDAGSMLWTALHSAADTATFGLADKASAGLAHMISPITGQPMTYDEAYQRIQANNAKNAGQNPGSALVGDIAGTAIGAGKLAQAARMVPGVGAVVDALAPSDAPGIATKVANVAKSAAVAGAGAGAYTAADDLARTGSVDPNNVLLNTAVGGVAGPVVSKIGTAIANGVQSSSTKAMQLLASKLGETPDVLQGVYDKFQQEVGRVPTMAELVGLKSQGELRSLANSSPTIAQGVNDAADVAGAQRAQTLAQTVEDNGGGPAQEISQLTQARKQRMDQAMNPIRTNPVTITDQDAQLLADPRVMAAVKSTKIPELRADLTDAIKEASDNGHSSLLNVQDMDSIRKAIRNQQSNMANPASGMSHNPLGAKSMGNLADNITDIVTGADPAHPYAQALSQFENDSNYIKGFQHGNAGKTLGEAATPDLQNALATAEGAAGHQAGIVTRTSNAAAASPDSATRVADQLAAGTGDSANLRSAVGQQGFTNIQSAASMESKGAGALRNIAGRPGTEPEDLNGRQVAQGAAAVLGHSLPGIALHATRAIPSFSRLSPGVQKQITRYLADPAMTQQGINLLRKAGAKESELRNFAVGLSANAGLNAANTMGQ